MRYFRHELPICRGGDGGGDGGGPSGGSPGNPTGGPSTSANPADTGTNAVNDIGQVDAGVSGFGISGSAPGNPGANLGIAEGIAGLFGVTGNTTAGLDPDGNETSVTSFSFDPAAAAINGIASLTSLAVPGVSSLAQAISSLATGNSIGTNVSNAMGNPFGTTDVTGTSPGGTSVAGMGAAGAGSAPGGYSGLIGEQPQYQTGLLGQPPQSVIPKPELPRYGLPMPNYWQGNQFFIPPYNRILT